ncbi:enteropeptidase [Elysia marginata]|uniref:Enteropeptidase n=1 Tax=Elysia marginata TaxID=1093978 RepID=A0AAV4J1S7_9GAST|nr:enteropeptidase [Elysia marginata]
MGLSIRRNYLPNVTMLDDVCRYLSDKVSFKNNFEICVRAPEYKPYTGCDDYTKDKILAEQEKFLADLCSVEMRTALYQSHCYKNQSYFKDALGLDGADSCSVQADLDNATSHSQKCRLLEMERKCVRDRIRHTCGPAMTHVVDNLAFLRHELLYRPLFCPWYSYCKLNEFRCHDGKCLPGCLACDGRPHCFDSEDESGCSKFNMALSGTESATSRSQVQCANHSAAVMSTAAAKRDSELHSIHTKRRREEMAQQADHANYA